MLKGQAKEDYQLTYEGRVIVPSINKLAEIGVLTQVLYALKSPKVFIEELDA